MLVLMERISFEAEKMFQDRKKLVPNGPVPRAKRRKDLISEHVSVIKYHAYRIATQLSQKTKVNDLINAGILGLMDAAEKYDPTGGVDFKTYAESRIRTSMLNSLKELDGPPNWLTKKGKELTKTSRQFPQKFEPEAGDEELCQAMGIHLDELSKMIVHLKAMSIGSFHDVSKKYDENEENEESIIHYYPDGASDDFDKPYCMFNKKQLKKILVEAIDGLPRNEQLVVSLYYLEELTTKEIGAVLRVNQSRVLQLHTKAMLRLRTNLRLSVYFAA